MKNNRIGLMIATLLGGCADDGNSKPNVQLNDNPTSSYLLDIKFAGNPGPLSDVEATAHYRVREEGCAKPLPFSGAMLPPEHYLSLKLNKLNDGHYTAKFHKDALVDADYFDRGICHWNFQNVSIRFKSPSTKFVSSISEIDEDIEIGTPKIDYFLNADYFKDPGIVSMVFGEKAGFYLPKMGPQFQIIVSSQKIALPRAQ